jgi:hypothetical protein
VFSLSHAKSSNTNNKHQPRTVGRRKQTTKKHSSIAVLYENENTQTPFHRQAGDQCGKPTSKQAISVVQSRSLSEPIQQFSSSGRFRHLTRYSTRCCATRLARMRSACLFSAEVVGTPPTLIVVAPAEPTAPLESAAPEPAPDRVVREERGLLAHVDAGAVEADDRGEVKRPGASVCSISWMCSGVSVVSGGEESGADCRPLWLCMYIPLLLWRVRPSHELLSLCVAM